MSIDVTYLTQALYLANRTKGKTDKNPAVAAVIVNQFGLISYGVHESSGSDHAEVIAIKKAKTDIAGATIYVTLEPCVHTGATPPCVNAIIKAKIARVVYAFIDPNPIVKNKARLILQSANIEVCYYPIEKVNNFYADYKYFQENKKSFISLKMALTANRCICNTDLSPLCITGSDSNFWVHQMRRQHSAILTTARTIQSDNPSFTIRYAAVTETKPLIILSKNCQINLSAQCLKNNRPIVLIYNTACADRLRQYQTLGINCYQISLPINTQKFWHKLTEFTAALGYISLWCEVGCTMAQAIHEAKAFNLYYEFISKNYFADGLVMPKLNESLRLVKNMVEFSNDNLVTYQRR